jgi:adenylate kinase
MVILLFGPPGCGKGTQAVSMARSLGIPSISTGEIFRAECKAGTEIGKLACEILRSGGLVGDDIVNQMVAGRLSQDDCRNGFILDGYPRTIAQAEFLNRLLEAEGLPAPTVIYLDVPDSVLVARITSRRQCPTCGGIYNLLHQPPRRKGVCDNDGTSLIQREDDNEQTILARLNAYHEATGPLVNFYVSGDFHRVEGDRTPDEIHREIDRVLEPTLVHAGEPRRS